jgi:hypothetical protein
MTNEFFPKMKRGRVSFPSVGEYVYVPTCRTAALHVIGGRGKVTEVLRKSLVRDSQLAIEEHPGVIYTWNDLYRRQYELWQQFGGFAPRCLTDEESAALNEELKAKAAATEALRVQREVAIARYRAQTPQFPRTPTHVLKVKERRGSAKGEVGVAWLNEDGSLHVILNPCVVLSWNDDVHITLFPK